MMRCGTPSSSASALACASSRALGRAAEHDPPQLRDRALLDQPQQRAGAPDLDVVGMGAEREHADGLRLRTIQQQLEHQPAAAIAMSRSTRRPESQTSHGAVPSLVELFQALLVLQRVHRRPEAGVTLTDELIGLHQPTERLLDEVLTWLELIEQLGPHDEVPAVDPDVRRGHIADPVDEPTFVHRNDVEAVVGRTARKLAVTPAALVRSIIAGRSASVSVSP